MKKKKKEYEEEVYFEDNDDDEIELMDLVFILLRNWKLIVMTAVPVLVLGVVFAMTRPDVYKAKSTLMVSSGAVYTTTNLDNSEISRNQKLVTSYTAIAKSRTILRSVINKLDLDMSLDQVGNLIKVTPVEDTEFIEISYTDSSAQRSAMLVNEVSNLFMARIRDVMKIENLKIVEKARVPEKAESKKRSIIIAVSLILGIMLGVFVTFLLEFLHSKLRKPEDMEKILGCSALANIPNFSEEEDKKNKKDKIKITERKMFFKDEEDSHLAESLRVLRTNIHFMEESKNRVILFTSSIPKEGKSTVAANYAMSVAISGEKVLLIDCDIRRPRAHSSFGIKIEKGMGDVLAGNATLEEAILKNVEGGLDILPSKHVSQNVTEMFLGNRMKNLLEDLRKEYDLIVLDTPPIAVATDAVILSEYADGLAYVIAYDQVSKKELLQAKKLLVRAEANIYGLVVNKISKKAYSYGNYGYYNYNYGYYQDYIKGDK